MQSLTKYLSVCAAASKLLNTSPPPFCTAALDDVLASMKDLLHPEHFLYTKAAKRALDDHNKRKNYKKAHTNGIMCLNSYRKYKVSEHMPESSGSWFDSGFLNIV